MIVSPPKAGKTTMLKDAAKSILRNNPEMHLMILLIDERPEELPFDINQDVIELSDADYAIWYMDAMENYKKYDRKKVKFRALVYNPDKLKKGVFVPGRFAMTCCIEDVTFIGFKCKYDKEDEIPHKSWIDITAEVRVEFAREYKGKGPVLYPISIEKAQKPEDELVYFS